MKKYHSMISETLTFKTNIIGVTALFRRGKRRYLTNLHELFPIAHNKKMLKHSSTNIKINCINTVQALLETIISTKKNPPHKYKRTSLKIFTPDRKY